MTFKAILSLFLIANLYFFLPKLIFVEDRNHNHNLNHSPNQSNGQNEVLDQSGVQNENRQENAPFDTSLVFLIGGGVIYAIIKANYKA